MSAIAGIHNTADRRVWNDEIERMLQRVSHCGPDGKGAWCDERVGLGHRMLHTTAESLHEALPLIDQAARLAITADARLDNRRELIDELGYKARPEREITDSELILAAYKQWGQLCPEKLLGDFAFAVWDGRTQQLFCARDHFGAKPFFYHWSGMLFVFATEIKALFCVPEVPRRLKETRIGEYLNRLHQDQETTFFEGIFRLPPAHALTVRPEGVQMRRYWRLDPSREVRRASDEEYAEEFRAIFTEAVRCRLRSAYPAGAMLSGGLDSSSIACVARNLLLESGGDFLHTFSTFFEDIPKSDERSFIQAVVRDGGVTPHYLLADPLSPFSDFDSWLWYLDEPNTKPNLTLPRSTYIQAQQEGVRVVLDGLGGDSVVSHGISYLFELARKEHWGEFGAQLDGLAAHFNWERGMLLDKYLKPHLSALKSRGQWMTLAKIFVEFPRQAQYSFRDFYLDYGLRPLARKFKRRLIDPLRHRDGSAAPEPSIVSRSFAERIALEDRKRALRGAQDDGEETARQAHYRSLNSGTTTLLLEELNRASAPFQVEPRYPYYDRRLAEFCLALPPEQKLWQGWSRMVLRRAMKGILPEEIRCRGGKADFVAPFEHALRKYDLDCLEEAIQHTPPGIESYFDLSVLRERHRRYVSGDVTEAPKLWAAANLILWLQKSGLAGAANHNPQEEAATINSA